MRMRGLNFGGWFSQIDAIQEKDPSSFPGEAEHMRTFLGQDDFRRVRDWGFDHVRLPVDWLNVFNESVVPREENLALLDLAIDGKSVILSRTFSAGDFTVQAPFKVTDASITVFAGNAGIGVRGNLDFEINRVGKGSIKGHGDSEGQFRLTGEFNFDEKLLGGVKSGIRMSLPLHATGAACPAKPGLPRARPCARHRSSR